MRTLHRARATMLGFFHNANSFNNADHYDRIAGRLLRRLYARVAADVAAAGLPDGARVLDVGTGPGRVPLLIADASPQLRLDGLDLSSAMIDSARHSAAAAGKADRVTFVVGDVADLPYPDRTFDLVVSTMSQHHWPDPHAGMREIRRVLTPAGQVWIYDLRLALGRAEAAAQPAFPSQVTHRHTIRTGRLPLHPIGRLTLGANSPAQSH